MPNTKEWSSYELFEETEHSNYMNDWDDFDFPLVKTTLTHKELLSQALKEKENSDPD